MEDNSENINKIGKQARDIMERVFQGQKDIVNLETDKLAIVLKNWANKAVGQLEFKDMVDPANHLKPSFNIFEQKMLEYLGNALIEDAKTNAIKNGITLTEDDILVGLAEFSKKPELGSIINEIYSLHVEPKFREMEKAAIQLDEYKKNTINIPSKSELLNAVASNSREGRFKLVNEMIDWACQNNNINPRTLFDTKIKELEAAGGIEQKNKPLTVEQKLEVLTKGFAGLTDDQLKQGWRQKKIEMLETKVYSPERESIISANIKQDISNDIAKEYGWIEKLKVFFAKIFSLDTVSKDHEVPKAFDNFAKALRPSSTNEPEGLVHQIEVNSTLGNLTPPNTPKVGKEGSSISK